MALAVGALGGLVAGCDALLGLTPVDERSADAAPPTDAAQLRQVSVRLEQVRFRTSLEVTTLPAGAHVATTSWWVPDATSPDEWRVEPAREGPGGDTLVADVPASGPAILNVVDPNGVSLYLAAAAPDLALRFGVWGAASAAVAGPSDMLQVEAALPTPYAVGQAVRIDVIGPYMGMAWPAPLSPNQAVLSQDIHNIDFTPVVGAPVRLVEGDEVIVQRTTPMERDPSISVLTDSLRVVASPQAELGVVLVDGTLVPVDPTRSLQLFFERPPAVARLAATVPSYDGGLVEAWTLVSSPLFEYQGTGVTLAHGTEVPSGGTDVAYGDPFTDVHPDWGRVMTHHIFAATDVEPMDVPELPGNFRRYAGMVTALAAPDGASLTIDHPLALPQGATLAGTDLVADGAVTIEAGQAPLSLAAAYDDGSCDRYAATLMELMDGGVGQPAARRVRAVFHADEPTFLIPRAHVVSGVPYVIRLGCYLGVWADPASGDYASRALPYRYGYMDTPVFVAGGAE